ncbi:hypothetical protein [Micromonospora sp. LOL_023]|uniref:hypothetical protein n=1 Tax=Micromonospora sp. LOL_023 TaxID=3345418 RepID=UPI003A8929D9
MRTKGSGLVVVVAAALTAVLALSGCGAVAGGAAGQAVERGGDPAADRTARTLSAAEVEANAKVRLPPGTVLLSTSFQSALDWHLTAMFRFPAGELPRFLADSGFPQPEPGLRAVRDTAHSTSDTWRPDQAVTVSGVEQLSEPVDGVFRSLLLDLDRPDEVTGYLVAFTT